MTTIELQPATINKLTELYNDQAGETAERLSEIISRYPMQERKNAERWTEKDILLITYADMLRSDNASPLSTLAGFLCDKLSGTINTVHILPFFPYSSDDGFSVIDYRAVNPDNGTWQDIEQINKSFSLMFDLVLNHVSAHSEWVKQYSMGHAKYKDFFHEIDPDTDLSKVVRPRNLPLLTEFETAQGTRNLWTTFSEDQIDLNFSNPSVLLEMVDILLDYIQKGAHIIRLDAIAYLWKEPDTPSIHLPETHMVVKLLRDILNLVAPDVIILTETNVPHEENMSYMGDGLDEAHMVYQFTLPPLLLHALLRGTSSHLSAWASKLTIPNNDTSFLNFTASHDGIGVRPLEGILPTKEILSVVADVNAHGGLVSMKNNSDGTSSPYEINCTYYSALRYPEEPNDDLAIDRFLATQAIMLALQGVPAIYFHSLFGSANAHDDVDRKGTPRSINRKKFRATELRELLDDPRSVASRVFQRYSHMIRARISEPSFHPNIPQEVLTLSNAVFALRRADIISMTNVTNSPQTIKTTMDSPCRDILTEETVDPSSVQLAPYQTRWLKS